jgi:hypothetical protein
LVLVGLWLLAGIHRSKPPSSDVAGVASRALDMAERAYRDAMAVNRNGTILTVLALAVGVAAPLVVAYLVHRLHARSEPPPEEVLETLDKARLLDWQDGRKGLVDGTHAGLTEAPGAESQKPSDVS